MLVPLAMLVAFFVIYRLYSILPNQRRKPSRKLNGKSACSVAVFLGSGGHTSEALTLVSALDTKIYNRRVYVVSTGDDLSVQKALDFEVKLSGSQEPNCSILSIPRARRIHQSLITTPISAAFSLLFCTYHLTLRPLLIPKIPYFADVLILNGPGTCFILCIAVYINKFLGLHTPAIIYVETFARVKSLSLSGKLIHLFADRFVIQWPRSQNPREQLRCDNWLV